MFDTADNREGSISPVPTSLHPGYPSPSLCSPQITPELESDLDLEQEEALPVPTPIFTRAPSNMLSVQQIYQRIQLGIDLNQVTFNEGGITFQKLQTLD